MVAGPVIPEIDAGAIFGAAGAERDRADRSIMAAASDAGFMTMTGLPGDVPIDKTMRRKLLQIFDLPEAEVRKLWRWNFDHSHDNVYRGWFPAQDGHATYKEGIDIGPDLVQGADCVEPGDPLREATPMPADSALPGWRQQAVAYYNAMERTGTAVMRSLARGLGLDEAIFDAPFQGGISTLRLTRYPPRSDASFVGENSREIWTIHNGERRYVNGRPHVDNGFVTLLAQDGVPGLQARARDGRWIEVPPREGTLVVNFGQLLERWTGGRIRATEHRVLGDGRERFSIPFFVEPRAEAVITPLPLEGLESFEPFYYGDYLWQATTKFVEQHGIAHLRTPFGPPPRCQVPAGPR